jgi:O-methyltransferase involved in polyketide biosynthesis
MSHDPHAVRAAGPQGLAMAKKFSIETPQLGALVHARTISCDDALRSFSRHHERFLVVNIGSGYDSRPWRMADLGGAIFVALDLPVMIRDRDEVLPPSSNSAYPVIACEFDILSDNLEHVLIEIDAPIDLPMFFIWEGGSMYFAKTELDAFIAQIRALMKPSSRLWFDYPSASAVKDLTDQVEVKAFMDSMRMIGEPFMHGFNDVRAELSQIALDVLASTSAAEILQDYDPVMSHYSFALCRSS